jgi:hypothetical protein
MVLQRLEIYAAVFRIAEKVDVNGHPMSKP